MANLQQPSHLRSDNLWHRYKDGTTFSPGGGTVGPVMRMGVSEWSDFADGFSIRGDLLGYNSNAVIACVRRYENGNIPSSFSSTKGQRDVSTAAASWLSFANPSISTINSGSYDATIAAYFASIPPTHRHFFTYIHEVDNDKLGSNTAAQFTSACARIWNIKNANAQNPSNVSVGPILTAGPYRANTYQQYYPSGGQFDFVGADPYRFARDVNDPSYIPDPKTGGAGTKRTMQYLVGDMPAFAQAQGKPVAIGEYGAHTWSSDINERARWLNETDLFLAANNCIVACYFHSPRGGSGPWLIDRFHTYNSDENSPVRLTGAADPTSMQAFADILAARKP